MRPDPAGTIDARCDRFVDEVATLDPVLASFLGIAGHEDALTDLSPDGFAAREELQRAALRDVTAMTPEDDRQAVARAAFLERVGVDVALADAGLERAQVSVVFSRLHFLRMALELMPTEREEDCRALAARLSKVPAVLAGYRDTLRAEADGGRVVARRQYRTVAAQLRAWTGREGTAGAALATLVPAEGSIPRALRSDLDRTATQATNALAELGEFLDREMAPRGAASDAVGRDAYGLFARRYLGADLDLEEAYAWGWAELHRITREMEATAQLLSPGSTVREVAAQLDADPSTKVTSRSEFRDWMQALTDRTISELAGSHFDVAEPIRRVECMIAPANDGTKYYTAPSEDLKRPGRMWWAIPDSVEALSPWRETTTVFHEGVPGHHLQIAHGFHHTDTIGRWRRLMGWVSGHGEGWALYAERLMDDLGYLDDPAARLGMLDQQSFRAARVIVDIGIHLELSIPQDNPFGFHPGATWTARLGREFLGQHCLMDGAFLDFEIERYLGMPAQSPSYKLGERVWLDVREATRARQGSAFDLKEFHRATLDLGSLGLAPFRAAASRL